MNQGISFGSFVRQRRREMDLTQEELARRVGCAAITLRKIEADDLRPSVQIAERLAMALAIPLDDRAEFVRRARAVQPEASDFPAITPAPSLDEIGREDLTGRAIRGYALAERIGMGGFGSVYRAVQPNVEREVAIKIILPAFANHPDFIRRFEAEAQLVARLEHPHIVPLYDYWREPGVAYLVMRLLRGGNIQNLLGQGPLLLDRTSHLLEQICSALNAAHRIGVIHRDLKPANVLLDEDGNAYLADFGIAKNISNPDLENQTQIDEMVGTPHYMSPEQIRSLTIKPQTDVYCLGIMLYEMLTGALPFAGPTPFDFIQQHVNVPMPPLAAHHTGLPAALDAVIGRATAKNPEDRYEDALVFFKDFREAASSLLNDRPIIMHVDEETEIEVANPFKGLRAFSEADAENFFGRETLVQQLLARLGEGGDLSRFLAVIGPSGSGKSSVVRAGLIPALRRGGLPGSENWFVVDMLPGKHPFEELEASLLRVAVNPPEHLLSQLKDGNRGLLRAVQRILPADETIELVLVIDQFEEVFTLVEDEAERALLLENLAAAVLDERSRLRVVITLRADFTDKPLRYVDFGELMNRRFEFILPLTADELERAILNPTQRVGLKLEKGLVSTIIREVGNQPGALPLLQYALSELFDKREGRTLTNKAYKEIGGVLGALGRSAEVLYVLLDKESQSTARQVFLRLVTLGEGTEDTRRRILREELEHLSGDSNQLSMVIEAYGRARLLSFDRDPLTRNPTIEVAHEALLREWTRLREWLTESRADVRTQRQLNHAVQEWNTAQRDASFLMAGSRLEQFEGWSANATIALTQDERTFLSTSIAERDRRELEEQARQGRELQAAQKLAETERLSLINLRGRNRVITTIGGIAIVLAVIAGTFGLSSSQNAQQALSAQATSQADSQSRATAEANALAERNIAQQQSLIASVREIAGAANLNLGVDPERSILLALQAVALTDKTGQAPLIEAQDALHRAVQASRIQFTLRGHTGQVMGVTYSPDGKLLATIAEDNTLKIWDTSSGTNLISISTGDLLAFTYYSLSFSPDGTRIAASASDNLAKVWDVASGKKLLSLKGHTNTVAAVIYSHDGKWIATSSWDQTTKIWDAATGQEVFTIRAVAEQDEWVADVAFSPDDQYIATAGDLTGATIWEIESAKPILTIPVLEGVFTVAFSPDGKTLATGSPNATWNLWDVLTGQKLATGFGHTALMSDITFTPNGERIATSAEDGTARIWDPATGRELLILSGHTSGVIGVAFSPDGTHLATASRDTTVKIWDISPTGGSEWFNLIGHTDRVWDVAYSQDGKYIATAGLEGTAKLWDAANGNELYTFGGFQNGVFTVLFSPDSKRLAATGGYYDGYAKIFDTTSGKELLTIPTTGELMVFSPDGLYLSTTNIVYDNGKITEPVQVKILDAETGKELFTLNTNSKSYINQITFSSDGSRLAAGGGDDGMINVWDVKANAEPLKINNKTGVFGVAFSPDSKMLATVGDDGLVHIWDPTTGKELHALLGHTGSVHGVAFSPDGKYLASSSVDSTVKIWSVTDNFTSQPLTLLGHTRAVFGVAFSPDGTRIVTSSRDTTARVYALSIQDLIEIAQSRVTRQLTLEECQKYLHVDACPATP